MQMSEQVDQLGAAMAAAQGEFTTAERDYTAKVTTKKGSDYSFNYADLAAYLDVCRGPLSKNGIAVFQEPVAEGRKARVTTLIVHKSGQWIKFDPLELEVAFKEQGETPTPQEMGSLITYARRYSQSAALNMASEADDDGNAASGNHSTTGKRAKPPCPQCARADFVYEDRQKGGFFCWKQKGGCGHNWLPVDEQPPADDHPPKKEKAKPAPSNPPLPKDPDGNFDHVGSFKKRLAAAQTTTGLNDLLDFLKKNKGQMGGSYQSLIMDWFVAAIDRAEPADKARFAEIEKLLQAAKKGLPGDWWMPLGTRMDSRREKAAA